MSQLDTYTTPLTAKTVAHLLRRATFGPTQSEIANFVGKTAEEAVDILIRNSSYRASPAPPIEMDASRSDAGQPFLSKPYDDNRDFTYYSYIQYWWIGLMTEQTSYPSVLEKLTAFWQNHFVTVRNSVLDYRFVDRYIRFLRANALGNFRDLVIGITKDPSMLIFQNGNENTKERPNENYGRELQELFTVGQKDFAGKHTYTEQDVKAAARVLTGWQATNRRKVGSTTFEAIFTPDRHDTSNKVFSSFYNNTTIVGRTGETAGDSELNDLVNMLLKHPETPKFICRKLYRWYVNSNVTQEIEDEIIVPLADFFASPSNNYSIIPVLKKLLISNIFYDTRNIGSIIKSPAELIIGVIKLFDIQVPDITKEYDSFRKMINFVSSSMETLQLNLLNQPSVFGSIPYYQTGYSKNWINGTTLGLRGSRTDILVNSNIEIKPGQLLEVDIINKLKKIQPNFTDFNNTAAISCEDVLNELSKNLFAVDLSQSQKDFLIDSIMMMNSSPRSTWIREWNSFRASPNDLSRKNTILWRCRALLKYMLKMAEFQVF